MEYLDLYDENKNFTGEKIIRGKGKPQVPEGKYINIVIIFIQNSKDEFLIQKTSEAKNREWATTGGHVKSGQTSKEAIIEEVKEELGLDIKDEDIKLIDTNISNFVIFDTYYLKKDIDINTLTLQEEEVEFVKWLSIIEIRELISSNNFRKSNVTGFEKLIKIVSM